MVVRLADFFCGLGGIRLGIEQAFGAENVETVYANDNNKFAVQAYEHNFPSPQVDTRDIRTVDVNDIPEFDIYCGGFPCQPFSVAGERTGARHKSGDLFQEGVIRIVKYHCPKVIFLENVATVLSERFKRQLRLYESLEDCGYNVFSTKLNSKYFGVSQNRNRAYIICFRQDIDSSKFMFPIPDKSHLIPIGDILDPSPIPGKYYITNRQLA